MILVVFSKPLGTGRTHLRAGGTRGRGQPVPGGPWPARCLGKVPVLLRHGGDKSGTRAGTGPAHAARARTAAPSGGRCLRPPRPRVPPGRGGAGADPGARAGQDRAAEPGAGCRGWGGRGCGSLGPSALPPFRPSRLPPGALLRSLRRGAAALGGARGVRHRLQGAERGGAGGAAGPRRHPQLRERPAGRGQHPHRSRQHPHRSQQHPAPSAPGPGAGAAADEQGRGSAASPSLARKERRSGMRCLPAASSFSEANAEKEPQPAECAIPVFAQKCSSGRI
ncbi:uncharacterized protein LOC141922551 [Strix aluco]|uniref:uncharacterized protein LOC141922551 n=1 Tax=Strix aluco TaxID=111821 RepID=UPI003DA41266